MIKACSFLPAVTRMIYDMGLQEQLLGVTFECPPKALLEKKVVVRCVLEGKAFSSMEIDQLFSKSKREGRSLYYVDEEQLGTMAPDIIFTQDVCDVCQINTKCAAEAVSHLEKEPLLISITPNTLEDVFENAMTIALAMGQEAVGRAYVAQLRARIQRIRSLLTTENRSVKRVSLLEWIDPIFNCGHWIPDQIAMANAIDKLSNPAGDSTVLSWEKLVEYNPEVLVIAPCGFKIERSIEEMHVFTKREAWPRLKAVQSNSVYLLDFELFTQSSASTLVTGIEVLAALFHPKHVPMPRELVARVHHFSPREVVGD